MHVCVRDAEVVGSNPAIPTNSQNMAQILERPDRVGKVVGLERSDIPASVRESGRSVVALHARHGNPGFRTLRASVQ